MNKFIAFSLFFVPLAVYLAYGLAAGKAKGNEFSTGRRDSGVFPIAAGLSATYIGGASILSLSTLGYQYGYFPLIDPASVVLALVVAGLILPIKLKDKNSFSIGHTFQNSPYTKRAVGLLVAVVYVLIFSAQIKALEAISAPALKGWSTVFAVATAISIAVYVVRSGYNSVTRTDVLQVIVMFALYIIPAWILIILMTSDQAAGKAAESAPDFQTMPLSLCVLLALPLLFVPSSQDLHIRIQAAKTPAVAKRGMFVAAGIYFVFALTSIMIGRLLSQTGAEIATGDSAVNAFFELWVGGWSVVLVIPIAAIIISTMDSALLSVTAGVKYDLLGIEPVREENRYIVPISVAAIVVTACLLVFVFTSVLDVILSALVIYSTVLLPALFGKVVLGLQDRISAPITLVMIGLITVSEITGVFDRASGLFGYLAVHVAVLAGARLCQANDTRK